MGKAVITCGIIKRHFVKLTKYGNFPRLTMQIRYIRLHFNIEVCYLSSSILDVDFTRE